MWQEHFYVKNALQHSHNGLNMIEFTSLNVKIFNLYLIIPTCQIYFGKTFFVDIGDQRYHQHRAKKHINYFGFI